MSESTLIVKPKGSFGGADGWSIRTVGDVTPEGMVDIERVYAEKGEVKFLTIPVESIIWPAQIAPRTSQSSADSEAAIRAAIAKLDGTDVPEISLDWRKYLPTKTATPTAELQVESQVEPPQSKSALLEEDIDVMTVVGDTTTDDLVKKINERYYVVGDFGGRCVICSDSSHGLTVQTYPNFKMRYGHKKLRVGTKTVGHGDDRRVVPVSKSPAEIWFENPNRRQYERIIFAPGENLPSSLHNLWRGFAFTPVKGDCSLYLQHLRDNICMGSDECYQYVLNWMATKIRRPGQKNHTALVWRGPEGIGKNVAFDGFGKLFGPHSLIASSSRQVTGHFNAHLRTCSVLCANEAFCAETHQDEATLKTMITDETLMIEAKGVDITQEINRMSVIMMSNERWVVPAHIGSRRFTVLDCGVERKDDTVYFGKIVAQLEHGGYEALLHYFMYEVDLSAFDERKILKTGALADQQVLSLQGVDSLWFDCLVRGALPFSRSEDGKSSFLRSETLFAWARKQNRREWKDLSNVSLGLLLGFNPRGNHHPGMKFKKCKIENRWAWVIPSLQECRALWDTSRFKYDLWDETQNEWDECVD